MKLAKEDSPGTKRWLRPAGVNEKSSPDEVAKPRFCGGEGMEVHGMGGGEHGVVKAGHLSPRSTLNSLVCSPHPAGEEGSTGRRGVIETDAPWPG